MPWPAVSSAVRLRQLPRRSVKQFSSGDRSPALCYIPQPAVPMIRRALFLPLVRQYSTKPPFTSRVKARLAQLDSLFLTGVTRFHEITGYSEIERLKEQLVTLEGEVDKMRSVVKDARDAYQENIARRTTSQKEMNELLMRKPTWVSADLERFTQLYKDDHQIQLGVDQAKKNYDNVESQLEEMQLQAGKLIGARYREEQMFSDRIRQASTWGTWVLMAINVFLFVVVQLVLEPWKRRRLVRSFEAKVQQMLDGANDTKLTDAIGENIEPSAEHSPAAVSNAPLEWSNLCDRLNSPELVVRPVEIGVLALAVSFVAGVMPLVVLTVSGR